MMTTKLFSNHCILSVVHEVTKKKDKEGRQGGLQDTILLQFSFHFMKSMNAYSG